MLEFFRKRQRIFFLLIAGVTILSFTFFGAYRVVDAGARGAQETADCIISKALDGSDLSQRELKLWAHFLSSGLEDSVDRQRGRIPSLLNDSLVYKDFLVTGLGEVLAQRYFSLIQSDVEERLRKVAYFQPYVHPKFPLMSAEEVWGHFAPALKEDLEQLRAQGQEATPLTFKLLAKTYVDQAHFPASKLQHTLLYQQQQFSWLPPDPNLVHADFSLFGFHTVEEWFGRRFLQLIGQVIIDAAIYAEEKGYQVSKEEADADLLRNTHQALQLLTEKKEISYEETRVYMRQELTRMGMNEKEGVELWRRVLLFRRLFRESGGALFFDSFVQSRLNAYAKEELSLALYELPESLHLKDFRTLLKLRLYLDAVAPKRRALSLPKVFLSREEVERTHPQLVHKRYVLDLSEVTRGDLARNVTLKEIWEWELDERNWGALQSEFTFLTHKKVGSYEERFALLEGLEESMRTKVDLFATLQIIKGHPEWISEALDQAPLKKKEIGIAVKSDRLPLKGIRDGDDLIMRLEGAPIEGGSLSPDLTCFTQDWDHFYRIRVLDRASEGEVMTFSEAEKSGILDDLLDQRLQESYLDVRKRDPSLFQDSKGEWRSFGEVKNEIGAKLYADVLQLIDDDQHCSDTKGGRSSLDRYPALFLHAYLEEAREHLIDHPEDPAWVRTGDSPTRSLSDQWLLNKKQEKIARNTTRFSYVKEAFSLSEGGWSKVVGEGSRMPLFFRFLERCSNQESGERVVESQKLLSFAAQRDLMGQLLQRIEENAETTLGW
jgi:GcvH upstream region-like protein